MRRNPFPASKAFSTSRTQKHPLSTGLTNIDIPAGVTSIGNCAFSYTTAITAITVDPTNVYYVNDAYGVLFDKAQTLLIQYPAGNPRSDYSIPIGVTSIGGGADQKIPHMPENSS
jgi:hypothetical protein